MSFIRKILNDEGWQVIFTTVLFVLIFWISSSAFAMNINGQDLTGDMETVGSLFKTADTLTFSWFAPFAAGIFAIIGCVGLVRSHFAMFILGFAAAILILVVPKFVGEVRKRGGNSILGAQVFSEEPRVFAYV